MGREPRPARGRTSSGSLMSGVHDSMDAALEIERFRVGSNKGDGGQLSQSDIARAASWQEGEKNQSVLKSLINCEC